MTYAGKLLSKGIKVVDLSADYRLPKEIYEKVYGVTHSDYFAAPYGIPELHRTECVNAKFVANPGVSRREQHSQQLPWPDTPTP